MITTALSTLVGAPRDRVWRALTDPAEIVRWDERAVRLLDPVAQPLAPGRVLRWRYLVGGVPLELREEITDLVPEERLHSAAQLGLFRFEQTDHPVRIADSRYFRIGDHQHLVGSRDCVAETALDTGRRIDQNPVHLIA